MCKSSLARVLIQGSSRGIGLQFCKTLLLRRPHVQVIATCRRPDVATELYGLSKTYPDRLEILQIDVTDEAQIKTAADTVEKQHGYLDLLVNCAGILHPSGRGETSLKDVHMEGLIETCKLNAFGPLLMGKHFGRLLQMGDGRFGGDNKEQASNGVLVNISAKVGSITDNGLGGWYSYRMSKAALNMANRNLSIELGRGKKKVVCVNLHPGTVDTDLSRPYHKNVKNLFTTEQCVDKLLAVIDSLKIEDSGKFFMYNREELPF